EASLMVRSPGQKRRRRLWACNRRFGSKVDQENRRDDQKTVCEYKKRSASPFLSLRNRPRRLQRLRLLRRERAWAIAYYVRAACWSIGSVFVPRYPPNVSSFSR